MPNTLAIVIAMSIASPTPLIHCVYTSIASLQFEPAGLVEVLEQARTRNAGSGLTGILLFAEGNFFQVLEGTPDCVDALYERILHDTRHRAVTRVIREPITERAFASWTMGFCDIAKVELQGLLGVNDFFDQISSAPDVHAGRARKLIEAFRQGRWRRRFSAAPGALA